MIAFLIMAASFLVAIGVLVTAHEFGHFWVARRLGFKVLRFSIGFGRPLWSHRGRDGVEYVLGMLPLGGYVKLVDEREGPVAPADLPRAFTRRPVWQRVLVLLAGAGANLVFAIVAYWALFLHGVPGVRPVIGAVRAGSPAAVAGLLTGDEIVSVGDRVVDTREAALPEILAHVTDDGRLPLAVRRGGGVQGLLIVVPAAGRRAVSEPGAWADGLGFTFSEPHLPVVLGRVAPDGAAQAAGLRAGDLIEAVDGVPVTEYTAFRALVRAHPGATLSLTVRRGGDRLTIPVVARAHREAGGAGPIVGQIGIESAGQPEFPPAMRTIERYGPLQALGAAVTGTWDKAAITVKFLWRMVTGHVSLKNVSGPISIATYAGVSAVQGVWAFLDFLAVISISLAVLNLAPIPILDGGQVVYQLAEGIRGRPVPERIQVLGQQVGIALLLLLMSLAFYNDIAWRFG